MADAAAPPTTGHSSCWSQIIKCLGWLFWELLLRPWLLHHHDVWYLLHWEESSLLLFAWLTFLCGAAGGGVLISEHFLTVIFAMVLTVWTLYEKGVVGLARTLRAARQAAAAPPPAGDPAMLAMAKARDAARFRRFDDFSVQMVKFLPPSSRIAYAASAAIERTALAPVLKDETAAMIPAAMLA